MSELKQKFTLSGDLTSREIETREEIGADTLQVNLSGTGSCTVEVYESLDGANFAPIPGTLVEAVTEADGSPLIFHIADSSPKFYKVQFTAVVDTLDVEIWQN